MRNGELELIKLHWRSFGEDVLYDFQKRYNEKGLTFKDVNPETLLKLLREKVQELENDKGTIYNICVIGTLIFMLYFNKKEQKDV